MSNPALPEKIPADYLAWLRARVGHALIPLVSATAIVRDERGRILFQWRTDFQCWGLPGGILEPGESPAACVRRETLEETGLQVEPERLTAALSSPRHNVLYPNGDRIQQVTFFFVCRVLSGILRADQKEVSAVAFFHRKEMPSTLPWYRLAIDTLDQPVTFFDSPEEPACDPAATPTWALLRRHTGTEPLVLPGATAIIRRPDGCVLLARRKDTGLWMPPGGLLELGETLADTIMREVREETALAVTPVRVCGVFGGHRVVFPGGDILYPVSTWFECSASDYSPKPDGEENDRTEFFSPGNLPRMAPGVEARLRMVLTSPHTVVFPDIDDSLR